MDKDNDDQFFLDAMAALNQAASTQPIPKSDHSFVFNEHPDHWLQGDEAIHHPRHMTKKDHKQLKKKPTPFSLDLHGLTRDEATPLLLDFIQDHLKQQHAVIRLICGKGRHTPNTPPLLKNLCFQVLLQHPAVHAFTTAADNNGGTGCFQVQLRYDTY